MLLDIRPDYLQIVRDILQKHVPQYEVWAFGFRAKWTAKEYSDLDLCIVSDKPLSFSVLGAIGEDFSESDLPWKVDVVDWATTSPSFRKIIERDKVVIQDTQNGWDINSEWKLTTLGDFAPLAYGKSLPERERVSGSHPVLSSGGVTGSHNQALVKSSGIVIGRKGTVGSVTLSEKPFWVIDTAFYIADEPEKRDLHFTYYLLKTLGLNLMNSDSAVPGLNRDNAHALSIRIPPLTIQRSISSILRSLDDKIALLRESNATLEAIAQALFKSWFVNFDPVHAKAECREPEGIPPEIAALLPSEFEDSELGEIPKGWKVQPLGDVIKIVGGGTPSTKEPGYWEPPEYHWVTPKDLSGLSAPVLLDTERKLSSFGIKKVSSGMLPEQTLLLSSRAPIGYLAIAKIQTAINQGFIAILPHVDFSAEYLLLWCRQNMESIKQKSNGSTFMEISKSAFRSIQMVVPPAEVAHAFRDIASPIYQRMAENERQANLHSSIRDTLLPRLMSGKLSIPKSAPEEVAL